MAIEYKNLEVEVSRCTCKQQEVRILDSPIDRPRIRFDPGTAIDEIQAMVDKLAENPSRELAREIGIALHELLLRGEVRKTFRESVNFIRGVQEGTGKKSEAGLRLRFSFGKRRERDARLANFPWELLCDPETEMFIGDLAYTPIVRYMELSEPTKRLNTRGALKILAVTASPKHEKLHQVDASRHFKILEAVDDDSDLLEIHHLKRATMDHLHDELERHRDEGEPFHGVHFLGHGYFSEDRKEGGLCFEKEDGTLDIVAGNDLNAQLAGFKDLRFVMLAACSGAKTTRKNGENPFTGVASALIAGRMPAVVAMQFNISEPAAVAFVEKFYKRLGSSTIVDVEEAVVAGRLRIARMTRDIVERATPVLYLRSPDGKLIDLMEKRKPKMISIYNIEDHGAQDLRVSGQVDLTRFFRIEKGRAYLKKDEYGWNRDVLATIEKQIEKRTNIELEYQLFLAAPISVAFAAGFLMEAKSGRKVVSVVQRGLAGNKSWTFEGSHSASAQNWLPEDEAGLQLPTDFPGLDPAGEDLIVAVSLTRPTLPAIGTYLRRLGDEAPSVGSFIHAVPERGPASDTIEDGAHANYLATELMNWIHNHFSGGERKGTVHLFMAVPNGLAYALGRLAKLLPAIQLYEYDFTGGQDGGYTPSIRLS